MHLCLDIILIRPDRSCLAIMGVPKGQKLVEKVEKVMERERGRQIEREHSLSNAQYDEISAGKSCI